MKHGKRTEANFIVFVRLKRYLSILLIPMLFLALCCASILVIEKDEVVSEVVEAHKQSMTAVDQILDEVEGFGRQIAANEQVRLSAYKEYEGTTSYFLEIKKMQEALPDIASVQDFVYDYFIFLDKSEQVFNRDNAYTYGEFYTLHSHEQQYKTYEEWLAHMRTGELGNGIMPEQNYVFGVGDFPGTLLVCDILIPPHVLAGNSLVRIYLKKEAIAAHMPPMTGKGMQFLADGQGNIFYYQSTDPCDAGYLLTVRGEQYGQWGGTWVGLSQLLGQSEADRGWEVLAEGISCHHITDSEGTSFLVVRSRSRESGCTYITVQPALGFNRNAFYALLCGILIVFLAALAGILYSIRNFQKKVIPVSERIRRKMEGEKSNGYGALLFWKGMLSQRREKAYEKMKEEDETEVVISGLKEVFLTKLLYGKAGRGRELQKYAEYVCFEYPYKKFWVVIFQMAEIMEAGKAFVENRKTACLYLLSVVEVLEEVSPGVQVVCMAPDRVVAIFARCDTRKEDYRGYTEEVLGKMREELPSCVWERLCVYGGSLVPDMEGISSSFADASSLEGCWEKGTEEMVIWYEE